jgi:hypothetical protein
VVSTVVLDTVVSTVVVLDNMALGTMVTAAVVLARSSVDRHRGRARVACLSGALGLSLPLSNALLNGRAVLVAAVMVDSSKPKTSLGSSKDLDRRRSQERREKCECWSCTHLVVE